MSRMVAGTVFTKSRPGEPKTSQSTKAWRRQERSSSSVRPWRAARPKRTMGSSTSEPRGPRERPSQPMDWRETISTIGWKAVQICRL